MDSSERAADSGHISRRRAMKKGIVGAAVAGAVWNAPKIEGLTLRPAYAAAQSGGAMMGTGSSGPADLPDRINIDIDIPLMGLAMSITEVSLFLDIDHTWMGDLRVTLTSPAGTTITMLQNICNFFPRTEGMQITLDDDAANPVGTACTNPEPYLGSFQPVQPLSTFDGEDPNGTWVLNITDSQNIDAGRLNNSILTIEAM